uniref:Uncharacterized protein n=1 Tax=Anguilla anguilla TaxID=7936 RepID=A0A0E9VTU3_ANGAN
MSVVEQGAGARASFKCKRRDVYLWRSVGARREGSAQSTLKASSGSLPRPVNYCHHFE